MDEFEAFYLIYKTILYLKFGPFLFKILFSLMNIIKDFMNM